MFRIIFSICLALIAADMTRWTAIQNTMARHRATNLNRVRSGQDAFAGYKFRTIPDNSKAAQNRRKSERNALQNHMLNSYRKRMF
jgi:hypothetical protein